jgi:hypothetical protein
LDQQRLDRSDVNRLFHDPGTEKQVTFGLPKPN